MITDISEIENKAKKLRQQEAEICRVATSGIKEQISAVEAELTKFKLQKQKENRAGYLEIADMVGEMAKLSFLTYVFGGFDNKFEISHHVNVIEARDEGERCGDGWHHYKDTAAKGDKKYEPDLVEMRNLLTKIQRQYEQYVGGEESF